MNPIFTASNTKGLNGYWYDEFVSQFDNICKDHLETKRAKKFAFIVYDFHSATHSVLENQGVFTDLDRLSGQNITIFYLDGQLNEKENNQNILFENLNQVVTELSNQRIKNIPFIVFFDFVEGDIENFKCYVIRDDERFILNDLTNAISKELQPISNEGTKKDSSIISILLKETPKIVYTEFIKLILNGIIEIKKM
jgi:hypothetical protein